MQTSLPLHRLAFALALCLGAASLASVAAEPRDTTRVEIGQHGSSEVVVLEDLAIGESRQLYSEAGTRVTATRTAEAIELDIGGDKTRVVMPAPGLSDDAIAALVRDAHAADDGKTRIVRVHRADAGDATTVDVSGAAAGDARVVVIKRDGDVQSVDLEGIDVLLDGAPAADGKRIIVKRTITSGDAEK